MSSAPHANNAHGNPRATTARTYARVAGFLFLLSLMAGGFGEAYVPSRLIVSGDASATANNIHTFGWLFRLGFATYVVEAVCDVALALIFYVLLRPVHRYLSLLAAFFGLVSTAVFAVAELFYFAPAVILGGGNYLKTFSPDQLNSLALLSLKMYGLGGGVFMFLYGVPTVLRGYLIFRSGYIPKLIGVLLVLAGIGFVAKSFALVLAPAYASDALLLPMLPAGITLIVWLLVKGVNIEKWEANAAAR